MTSDEFYEISDVYYDSCDLFEESIWLRRALYKLVPAELKYCAWQPYSIQGQIELAAQAEYRQMDCPCVENWELVH
jgi:hypothetical protein